MERPNELDWREAQRLDAERSRAAVAGLFSANLWVVLPALALLPIMGVFGEGDYIVPIAAIMWAALFFYGLRVRRVAQPGSLARSRGFWISFWSAILALMMLIITITLLPFES